MELARPREPFALYERRGPGQLLFDMGIAGDFVANITQRNVDKANAGTFAGPREPLLPARDRAVLVRPDRSLRARARCASRRARRTRARSRVHLAEAHLTLMALPFGTQLKMGQMRNRFGLLNELHAHDRPFSRPARNVLTRFFGEEGLVERGRGAHLGRARCPSSSSSLAGVFNGDNETALRPGQDQRAPA